MRFIHTSDWHIGRQFHNVSLLEDQRHILDQLIEIIRREQVDALLISGDIYDRSVPPAAAVALLDDVVDQINREIGIPVILIAGNHDSGDRLSFGSRQLAAAGVHITGILAAEPSPVVLSDASGDVAFYGLPYADPATVRAKLDVEVHTHDEAMQVLTDQIRTHNDKQRRCVVMAHCFVEGGDESDSERPLSIGGVDRVSTTHFDDFHYVALGHLHGPQYRGAEHIRYSGSILKYSFSEEHHRKSVTLVELDADGECTLKKLPLTPTKDMRIIEGYLDELLEAGKTDAHADDYLMVRLLDTHAILDVMNKLRDVYPNVLHLERPALAAGGERKRAGSDHLQRGEMPMFQDFYQQMRGVSMDEKSTAVVAEILDQLHSAVGE
jgi:exonuclease SbcD